MVWNDELDKWLLRRVEQDSHAKVVDIWAEINTMVDEYVSRMALTRHMYEIDACTFGMKCTGKTSYIGSNVMSVVQSEALNKAIDEALDEDLRRHRARMNRSEKYRFVEGHWLWRGSFDSSYKQSTGVMFLSGTKDRGQERR